MIFCGNVCLSSFCVIGFREEVFSLYFYVSHGIKDDARYIVGAQLLKEHWRESSEK